MTARTALFLVLLAVVGSPLAAQGIQWRHDLSAAQIEAAQSGKLVLLHFWDTSCGPCIALDKAVFNQQRVADAIERQYVPVKVDPSQGRTLAQTYGVTRIPTDVILSPEGKIVSTMISPNTPEAYIGQMTKLASDYATRTGTAYDKAIAKAAPYGNMLNNAYSGLDLTPQPRQPLAQGPSQPPVTQPPVTQPPVTQPSLQKPAPEVVQNQYAQQQPPAAQPQQTQPPATQQPPVLPPGSPPLGFEGFCTVSMMKNFKWVQGDAKWGAIHRGRTYLFAGQAERDEFLRNPDAFCPVLSGLDPVAAVEQNRAVPGSRKFAVQYPPKNGQFYLFNNEQNLKKFSDNPAGFAEGVRQAMSTDGGMYR